jgi:hypothetical protein
MSLENVITTVSNAKPIGSITSLERIRLARSLALAVLRFNNTPWLPETWRSSDIHFYGVDSKSLQRRESLGVPRLNIKLPRSQKRCDMRLSPIRNPVPFGLGLVLMELGFETPVRGLAQKEDFYFGEDSVEYLVAERLRGVPGTPMGARYGEITRKCLECDFNVSERDLGKPDLLQAVYKDVICELDGLESLVKQLDISEGKKSSKNKRAPIKRSTGALGTSSGVESGGNAPRG